MNSTWMRIVVALVSAGIIAGASFIADESIRSMLLTIGGTLFGAGTIRRPGDVPGSAGDGVPPGPVGTS